MPSSCVLCAAVSANLCIIIHFTGGGGGGLVPFALVVGPQRRRWRRRRRRADEARVPLLSGVWFDRLQTNYLELGLRGLLIFRWILLSSYLLNFMAKEFFLITNATTCSLYEKSKTRATASGFFASGGGLCCFSLLRREHNIGRASEGVR